MEITVLVENNTRIDNYLLGEPALSFLIKIDNKSILFDTGYSDVIIRNAKKLNIDLSGLDYIVLSHGHDDHTGGLRYLPANKITKLIAHPNVFEKKVDENGIECGCPISQNKIENKYNTILTSDPYEICPNLYFLGEIPNNKSQNLDDSALVYKSPKGLIIISGCSHAGILNIIRQAQRITQTDNIWTIIGGLHLISKTENEIEKLGTFLEETEIRRLYPCHCCDLRSKILLAKYAHVKEICTGDILKFC